MSLYVFTQVGFGAPFIALADESARRREQPVTVVVSARQLDRGAPGLRRRAHLVWKRWRLSLGHAARLEAVEDVNAPEFLERIAPGADGVVAGFHQIFRGAAIARFRTLVNLHPSLLPCYRGPVPSHWTLARGERWSGFTLHRLVERIDAGEILHQEAVEVAQGDTPRALDQRIALAAVPCVRRWIEHLQSGAAWSVVRLDALAYYRAPLDYASFPKA